MIYPYQRCKEIFESPEEVSLHLKKVKGCELQDIDIGDGITSEILKQLKNKKKAHRDETEEDRWRKIYMLLFSSGLVPSPCRLRLSSLAIAICSFICVSYHYFTNC